jgi:hypothetical protein
MADKRTRHTQARTGKFSGDSGGSGDVDGLQKQCLEQVATICQRATDRGKAISLFNARRVLRRLLFEAMTNGSIPNN